MNLYNHKKTVFSHGMLITIIISALLIFMFIFVMQGTFDKTSEESRKTVSTAIEKAITNCYALECEYPQSMEYLEEKYNLVIDKSKYHILYQFLGANIRPSFSVISADLNDYTQ